MDGKKAKKHLDRSRWFGGGKRTATSPSPFRGSWAGGFVCRKIEVQGAGHRLATQLQLAGVEGERAKAGKRRGKRGAVRWFVFCLFVCVCVCGVCLCLFLGGRWGIFILWLSLRCVVLSFLFVGGELVVEWTSRGLWFWAKRA